MPFSKLGQDLTGFVKNEITYLDDVINRVDPGVFVQGLAVLSAVLLVLILFQHRKLKTLKRKHAIGEKLYSAFEPAAGMEKTVHAALEIVRSLVKAGGYYLYLKDPKNEQYILKAIRYSEEEEGSIAPSYSGLLTYKKDTDMPPLSLPAGAELAAVTLSKVGQVKSLTVPIAGGKGLIRISPVEKLPTRSKTALDELGLMLGPALDCLLEMENLKNQVGTHIASSKALQYATNTTLDFEATLGMVMTLSLNMIGGSGGCFLIEEEDGQLRMPYLSKPNHEEGERFKGDIGAYSMLAQVLGGENILVVSKGDRNYGQLPSDLTAAGVEMVILLKVAAKNNNGVAAFWYDEIPEIEAHRLTGLQMMTKRMADLLDSNAKFREIAVSYVEMLRMMVETIDNLEPHTVGYSELMARYSEIIAREMKLDGQEIRDVVLAATLSNIGLFGFSNELLFKPGKYTDFEYDTMKLHSEVGASIIEVTIANPKVASYIRYHHERIDGNGYPEGLKWEEIPLGARIIAVVQTFLASITGRRYREPLPFEKSFQLLHAACGTQLDEAVVEALINWFRKKQAGSARKGRSLGSCWEMRCVPRSICGQCPAYQDRGQNCWEIEGTKCEAHGNKCPSCFVYTEFIYRMGFKGNKPGSE